MENAWSKDAKKVVEAESVWREHLAGDQRYTAKDAFRCLDEDHCGVKLILVNFDNQNAKLVYFKQADNGAGAHNKHCIMEYGTEEQKQKLIHRVDPQFISQREMKFFNRDGKLFRIDDALPENTSESAGAPDVVTHTSGHPGNPSGGPRIGSTNPNTRESVVRTLASVYSVFLSHPKALVPSINWPSYILKEGHRVPAPRIAQQLVITHPFELGSIFSVLEGNDPPMNKVLAFVFDARVSERFDRYYLSPALNENATFWVNKADVAGMPNVRLFRRAVKQKQTIKVVAVGHFYRLDDRFGWYPRTPHVNQWLYFASL